METQTEEKTTRHPYSKRLEATLNIQKKMLGHLENRITMSDEKIDRLNQNISTYNENIELYSSNTSGSDARIIKENYIKKSDAEYEINELEITKIKTQGEVDILKRVIAEKQNYFDNYMIQFEKDLKEVNARWDHVVGMAKKSKNPDTIRIMENMRWDRIEGDDEAKIAAYKQIRKLV